MEACIMKTEEPRPIMSQKWTEMAGNTTCVSQTAAFLVNFFTCSSMQWYSVRLLHTYNNKFKVSSFRASNIFICPVRLVYGKIVVTSISAGCWTQPWAAGTTYSESLILYNLILSCSLWLSTVHLVFLYANLLRHVHNSFYSLVHTLTSHEKASTHLQQQR